MASYLDKERINTAITDSTKFDLSHVHITTSNFMQLQPIYNKEMVPGEKIDVNIETLSRMNPLAVPTFGRANIKNRAYFVPFRTIFRGWNDFITDAPHVNSANDTELSNILIDSVPTVANNVLVQAFLNYSFNAYGDASTGIADATQAKHDIVFKGASTTYKRFTPAGRIGIKILESLGYKVNWNSSDTTKFSALPLLALAKVYTDWYFPSAYTNNTDYSRLLLLCNYDNTTSLELTWQDVSRILQQCLFVCYDSDYFTSAWDNPTQPGAGKVSNYKIPNLDYASVYGWAGTNGNFAYATGNIVNTAGVVTNNQSNTDAMPNGSLYQASAPFIGPFIPRSGATAKTTITPVSQYLLHGLHALTDFLKRNQLAGSRAMDRYLARYGKALNAEKLNRSVYLGCQTIPVQIGDVMSNSDTTGAQLGAYAGKAMAYGDNGNFSYQTDEFGMFIVLSTITPAVGYYQGINRNVKHIKRLDFWTPEFESLGTQPITSDELYMTMDGASALADPNPSTGTSGIHEKIFGFTPRYAEYKVGCDQVTGNYRIKTLSGDPATNNGNDSWHLMRRFEDSDFSHVDASNNTVVSIEDMVHSLDFVYSRQDLGDFNRIFYNDDNTAPDNFTLIHQFNIGDYAPMKPLYDSYEFEDKGKKVTLDVNGVKHN